MTKRRLSIGTCPARHSSRHLDGLGDAAGRLARRVRCGCSHNQQDDEPRHMAKLSSNGSRYADHNSIPDQSPIAEQLFSLVDT